MKSLSNAIDVSIISLAAAVVLFVLLLSTRCFGIDFVITERPGPTFKITERASPEKESMDFYTASWCVVCKGVDPVLEKNKDQLDFRINKIDFDTHGLPEGIPEDTSLPLFVWKNASGNVIYTGWNGLPDLKSRYKLSKTVAKPVPKRQPYSARWSYPGRIEDHMRDAHKISGDYSREELEAMHDQIHEGTFKRK